MMFCDWKLYICGDNGLKFFGKGPQILLYGVERLDSLHQAAAEMNLSYSKALHMIQTAQESLGFPLLETKSGGLHGGGSRLTPEARDLLARYAKLEALVDESVARHFEEVFGTKSEG